jgi:hypothetical protein
VKRLGDQSDLVSWLIALRPFLCFVLAAPGSLSLGARLGIWVACALTAVKLAISR